MYQWYISAEEIVSGAAPVNLSYVMVGCPIGESRIDKVTYLIQERISFGLTNSLNKPFKEYVATKLV